MGLQGSLTWIGWRGRSGVRPLHRSELEQGYAELMLRNSDGAETAFAAAGIDDEMSIRSTQISTS